MKMEYLREFAALGESLSYAKTATKLYCSPSTLSRHIAALERELGVRLLERSTRSVRLTAVGEMVLADCRFIMHDFETMLAHVRDARQGVRGSLSIAFPYYYANGYLQPAINAFRSLYPQVAVSLVPIEPQHGMSMLLAGEADVGIATIYPFAPEIDESLRYKEVARERLSVCMTQRHRLAGRDEVCADDLQGEEFVVHATYENVIDFHKRFFSVYGVAPACWRRAQSVELVEALILEHDAVALKLWKSSPRKRPGLVYVPFSDDRFEASVGFVALRGNLNPSVDLFFEALG